MILIYPNIKLSKHMELKIQSFKPVVVPVPTVKVLNVVFTAEAFIILS